MLTVLGGGLDSQMQLETRAAAATWFIRSQTVFLVYGVLRTGKLTSCKHLFGRVLRIDTSRVILKVLSVMCHEQSALLPPDPGIHQDDFRSCRATLFFF